MSKPDEHDLKAIVTRLKQQATAESFRITAHAHQEMIEDDVSLEELKEVLLDAEIIEHYPKHKRGPCCLICSRTTRERYIHVPHHIKLR